MKVKCINNTKNFKKGEIAKAEFTKIGVFLTKGNKVINYSLSDLRDNFIIL